MQQIVSIMSILVFLFGLLAGCLLAVIVGLIGSHGTLIGIVMLVLLIVVVLMLLPDLYEQLQSWFQSLK